MTKHEIRAFNGFNALVVDCGSCKSSCSLDNNECLKCLSNIDADYSLLELRKDFSVIYYDDFLKKKIDSGIFDLVPLIVPKFLLYYLVPLKFSKVLEDCGSYKIVQAGANKSIIFNPLEYNLEIDELREFSRIVADAQRDDSDSYDKFDDGTIGSLASSYTKGLGIFDSILSIPEIQDIFINSPGNSCVFFNHSKYGSLSSNLFAKKELLNRLATFLRADSGRPFDESFPVIHASIGGFNARVCGLCYPMSYGGMGFAIRKHQSVPFSIASLVNSGFMDLDVAALLWFLIDSDIKVLITGPRGSGKTTLLSSLLFLVKKSNRFIIIEDTAELPVPELKSCGFNVEHLRTNSFDSADSFEFSNDAALRAALRLGESLLILGEVRGSEARFLFEAMRIGASGNNVFGTIHGSSAYDTFDRVVNDLGVPPSSFKAADIVISCSYFDGKKAKGRRLSAITEVKKNWSSNPLKEKGFFDIVSFNPKSGKYFIDIAKSDLIKNIAYKKGLELKNAGGDFVEKKSYFAGIEVF
jgi:type IV secretory pathway ATPase VirB11/archaellum biosynthesis ATPase